MFNHIPVNLPSLDRVEIDGRRYYNTPGGLMPSVTTVLGHTKPNGLQDWIDRVGEREAAKISRQAAARGTRLHENCELYLKNTPRLITNPLDIALFKPMKPKLDLISDIHLLEKPLYSNIINMAGTVDCVGKYDGVLSIIDFKTSMKEKMEEWIEDYFLQATAYAIMFSELTNIKVQDLVILIANEEGTAQVFKEKAENWVDELAARRAMYSLFD